MYQMPSAPPPPRRLPHLCAAFAIACLGYAITAGLAASSDWFPALTAPPLGICVTYWIIAAYLESSEAYLIMKGLHFTACIISPGLGALLYGLIAGTFRIDWPLAGGAAWLLTLAILLYCSLARRPWRPVGGLALVDTLVSAATQPGGGSVEGRHDNPAARP